MAESYQEKLKRVRPPRVRIQYEVETDGAMREVELPFVVGIMADLSAQSTVEKKKLRDRKFTPIDRDNFNEIMAKVEPRVAFRVPNRIGENPDDLIGVDLKFKHIDDFEPARIAEQVPVLNELLTMRRQLTELLGKMEPSDELVALLGDVINNTEKQQALRDALAKHSGEAPKSE